MSLFSSHECTTPRVGAGSPGDGSPLTPDVLEDDELRSSRLAVPDERSHGLAVAAQRVAPIRGIEADLANVIFEPAVRVHEHRELAAACCGQETLSVASEKDFITCVLHGRSTTKTDGCAAVCFIRWRTRHIGWVGYPMDGVVKGNKLHRNVHHRERSTTSRRPGLRIFRSPFGAATILWSLSISRYSTRANVLPHLTLFVAAFVLFSSASAENCTIQAIYKVLEPVASDANFATCQTDSNYSLLSFASPSLNQTEGFCASTACQALLNATLASGLLPDCEVVIGHHSLNLTDAVAIAAKYAETALYERAVSKGEGEDQLGHTTDTVAGVVGHSVPMDELGDELSVGARLMALLRRE